MKPQELFKIWAPHDGLWSPWAKPVLFSSMPQFEEPRGLPEPSGKSHWSFNSDGRTAIIIDMPGRDAVLYGLICARLGFRPVPVFNGCPGPGELVPTDQLRDALFQATQNLLGLPLSAESPPAFLLDSRRMEGIPVPRRFDNRWMVFAQDFPSANKLKSARISHILVVQKGSGQPARDLARVLVGWQDQKLKILRDDPENSAPPEAVTVHLPSATPMFFDRMLVLLGLRKNSAGGFGSVIPEPSESSGYG